MIGGERKVQKQRKWHLSRVFLRNWQHSHFLYAHIWLLKYSPESIGKNITKELNDDMWVEWTAASPG